MTALAASQVETTSGLEPAASGASPEDSVRSDALSALLNLGYQRSSAEKAIDAVLNDGGEMTVESVLRRGLRKLARV
jgi:Holliday junction resolvasome RuvABC DNA-binding subunit